jgi:hypothetical protein
VGHDSKRFCGDRDRLESAGICRASCPISCPSSQRRLGEAGEDDLVGVGPAQRFSSDQEARTLFRATLAASASTKRSSARSIGIPTGRGRSTPAALPKSLQPWCTGSRSACRRHRGRRSGQPLRVRQALRRPAWCPPGHGRGLTEPPLLRVVVWRPTATQSSTIGSSIRRAGFPRRALVRWPLLALCLPAPAAASPRATVASRASARALPNRRGQKVCWPRIARQPYFRTAPGVSVPLLFQSPTIGIVAPSGPNEYT